MDLSKLKEPFPYEDIEWRLQSADKGKNGIWGKCLAYVTNRAICERLDEVCGPENWKNEFDKGPDGGVLCGISIKIGDDWVTKFDGAENTNIEAVKGGLSGAMKRAASTGWGIGRYLYNLEESWAEITDKGKFSGKTKSGEWFKWNPPATLPAWALPGGSGKPDASKTKQTSSKKTEPTPPSEDNLKKCEELKAKLVEFEDTIPEDSWKDIDAAVKAGSVPFLQKMLDWAADEAKKAS